MGYPPLDPELTNYPRCMFCGYSLGDTGEPRCPECGRLPPTPEQRRAAAKAIKVGAIGWWIVLVVVGAPLIWLLISTLAHSDPSGSPLWMVPIVFTCMGCYVILLPFALWRKAIAARSTLFLSAWRRGFVVAIPYVMLGNVAVLVLANVLAA